MKIYILIGLIVMVIIALGYFLVKKNKHKKIIDFIIKWLNVYASQVLNKVKLAALLNTFRAYMISKIKNKIWKAIVELFWPELDIMKAVLEIQNTGNKNVIINSVPDLVVSKTVDNILNNTKYSSDFATMTNLKITEKDRGYLEAYLEGQLNKLNESKIGIKGGMKF